MKKLLFILFLAPFVLFGQARQSIPDSIRAHRADIDSNAVWHDTLATDVTANTAKITYPGTPDSTELEVLNGAVVTLAEFQQLETIGTQTISLAQWTGLGTSTSAGTALWNDASASAQLVTLGLSATASEINTPLDGALVTLTEFQELETIDATTISALQWGVLGGIAATLTSTELDYVDGVTSSIQTQINAISSAQGATIVDSIAAYTKIFSASISYPQAGENTGLFYSTRSMTVNQFIAVLETAEAGGEAVSLDISWGSSIATASFGMFGGGTSITSITTGDISTSFTANTIPANNWVWVNVISVTGTVTNLLISVEYTE